MGKLLLRTEIEAAQVAGQWSWDYPDAAPEYLECAEDPNYAWAVLLETDAYVSDNGGEWYDDGCYRCHCHT